MYKKSSKQFYKNFNFCVPGKNDRVQVGSDIRVHDALKFIFGLIIPFA